MRLSTVSTVAKRPEMCFKKETICNVQTSDGSWAEVVRVQLSHQHILFLGSLNICHAILVVVLMAGLALSGLLRVFAISVWSRLPSKNSVMATCDCISKC